MYGKLGPPLQVVLSCPSSDDPDPEAADHHESVWRPSWSNGPSPESQSTWGESFAALSLSWPKVRSVTWDHWSDAEPHLVPHGGLLDAQGRPKPLLARLHGLRTMHLAAER
jgi:hypothetical protein